MEEEKDEEIEEDIDDMGNEDDWENEVATEDDEEELD